MTAAVSQQPVKPVPWWLVLLEGILSVALGAFLLIRPGMTFTVIVQVIAIYWLISGIIRIVSIFFDSSGWGWKLFFGVIGILAGFVLLGEPIVSALLFGVSVIWVMGFFGIVYGIMGIIQFFQGAGWWSLVLGVLSIIFGVLLLGNTVLGALMLPWVFGIFLIAGGIMGIIAAFQNR